MPTTSLPPATGVSVDAAVVPAPPPAVVPAPPPAVVPLPLLLSSLPHAAATRPSASSAAAKPKTVRRDLPDDRRTLPPCNFDGLRAAPRPSGRGRDGWIRLTGRPRSSSR